MIDLHCHSLFSDGDKTPNELLKKANNLELSFFSITDHNNCFAYENMDKKIFNGKLVTGVELVTSFEKNIIELLGYGVNTELINSWNSEYIKKEKKFAEEIYYNIIEIYKKIGIKYTKTNEIKKLVEMKDPTGKIKQFLYKDLLNYKQNANIIDKNILESYSSFNKKGLNNPNSILFLNEYKRFPTIKQVEDLIHQSGGLCFLAHIYQYNVQNHIEFLKRIKNEIKLDGIEVIHSSFTNEQRKELNDVADELNLYKSGGSDYHGKLKPGIKLGLDLQISDEIVKPWIDRII